jgi:hypothetical protein
VGDTEDLRKAVCEQNLHSIFRLLPKTVSVGDTEDLRKAVCEQNLHSIFRLCEDEDLRKFILEDNTWKLWTVIERYTNTQFVAAFKNLFVNNIQYDKDCFSRGQLQSKLWLIAELKKLNLDLGTVFLCAGWYATLSVMLFENGFKINKLRSFDIDPTCVDIAEVFNKPWFVENWKFKALTANIYDIDYTGYTWQYWSNKNDRMSYPITDVPTTIINTSCEHLDNFGDWYSKIPEGKLLILQANDFTDITEHVNTYYDLSDFDSNTPMSTILYKGKLELPKYTRFMKIGYK